MPDDRHSINDAIRSRLNALEGCTEFIYRFYKTDAGEIRYNDFRLTVKLIMVHDYCSSEDDIDCDPRYRQDTYRWEYMKSQKRRLGCCG